MPLYKKMFYSISYLILVLSSGSAAAQNCETDNAELRAMPAGLVEVTRADGSELSFEVRVANNRKTRAAGFQRVCSSTIAKTPILFVFSAPLTPRFHMHNVVAPIDIAFIRENGSIDSVQAMQPYVLVSKDKPLYSPSSNIIAALEGQPGFFDKNKIDTATHIKWSINEPTKKPK